MSLQPHGVQLGTRSMSLTFLGVLSMVHAETWAQNEGREGGVIAVLCSTYSGLSLSFSGGWARLPVLH